MSQIRRDYKVMVRLEFSRELLLVGVSAAHDAHNSVAAFCYEIPGSRYICNSGIAWTAPRAQLVHRT
jgi:hypothetical protein